LENFVILVDTSDTQLQIKDRDKDDKWDFEGLFHLNNTIHSDWIKASILHYFWQSCSEEEDLLNQSFNSSLLIGSKLQFFIIFSSLVVKN
jgi:hypothetical protein